MAIGVVLVAILAVMLLLALRDSPDPTLSQSPPANAARALPTPSTARRSATAAVVARPTVRPLASAQPTRPLARSRPARVPIPVVEVPGRVVLATPAPQATAAGPEAQEVGLPHLPHWLQSVDVLPLYADDGATVIEMAQIPAYAYLEVLGGRNLRVNVRIVAPSNQSGLVGWVDPGDVQPAEPGVDWMRNHAVTPLLNATDASAKAYFDLPQWTFLRRLGDPVEGMAPMRVYDTAFGIIGDGWVRFDDLVPIPPPEILVLSGENPPIRDNPFANNRVGFMLAVAAIAQQTSSISGVPVPITVAQAILESDWGDSGLSRRTNNLFGIKGHGGIGSDGVIWMRTEEVDGAGNRYELIEPFRAYRSYADSVADHDRLLTSLSRYQWAMDARHDPREFAYRLMEGGYSTDPSYADKLIALMDEFNLYQFGL